MNTPEHHTCPGRPEPGSWSGHATPTDRGGLSVWATGQRPAPTQRGHRYPAAAHPARMLPEIAATAITALTQPGDLVLDPLCGGGTTLIEALYLDRAAVGIDIDPHWAAATRTNITHAYHLGVGGHAHVITADAQRLPDALPPDYLDQIRGRVTLLLTGWPAGPPTHSHPSAGPNLTYQPPRRVAAAMATILRGAAPLMAPDSHIVITGRAWREHGELVDLPALITDTLDRAGMLPVQRCVALLAGIRDDELVTRASRYHRVTVARARAAGAHWHLPCTQEIILARPPAGGTRRARTTRPTPPPTASGTTVVGGVGTGGGGVGSGSGGRR